ncbi:MAG: M20/M25/M40 family metallo-hydrolase, partial [Neisseriaceae bacterium]|nr:M20/M25/M40 family metallo-hydrolase [Neisseriaceae bacterium]
TNPYPSISMIPTATTIRFDRRLLVGETQALVLQQIEDCLHAAGVTDFTLAISQDKVTTFTGIEASPERWLPAWQTEEDTPLLQATRAAVATAGLDTSIGAWPFCTNGSESAGKRHIPTVGLGPGNEEDAHTIDESIDVAQLIQAQSIYAEMVTMLCT